MTKRAGTASSSNHSQVVSKTITINASAGKVWESLTVPKLMQGWMFPTTLDIITDWTVGHPIVIRGNLHGVPFENKGTVLHFEPERVLRYSHLSSTSRLPDIPANYSIIEFSLAAMAENQTALTITVNNFPNEVIYKHLAYYWNVTLEVIKRRMEGPG